MTTDTSAEALEESIFWLKAKYRRHGEIEDRIAAEQLEYFQAEKRRARDGVTDDLIAALKNQRQIDADGTEVGVSRQAVDEAIASLEAVWPDGRDAKRGCVWSEDEEGNWDTGCGNLFVITEGTPYDNEFGYCCYCGGKLDQATQADAMKDTDHD